ncbi:hypothetical protein [Acetobacterium bakii]|uniref:Uncharacterized protein n=1 Tax=Acetobacterium bakii TaxID=52689 RepID=A0A0L6U3J6_9FIRM|nr:hypothetical protein [Acetobacterium bakii]KNZ43093.1 hypothetical protein AKG39_02775 [Acetobacterium bakii]
MKKITKSILSTVLLMSVICPSSAFASGIEAKVATSPGVQYKTHIQDIGWEMNWKSNGELSGTVNQSKRLEAIIVQLTGSLPKGATITTVTHVQDLGDLKPIAMGQKAGTEGRALRMESVTLTLNNLPEYRLKYNVQVEDRGWLRNENDVNAWFSGGEAAGTKNESLRLEGLKIKLVEINEEYEAYQKALAAVTESNYTAESWATYKKVADANKMTEDNPKADILGATKNILAAQENLVRGRNLTAYKAALAAVNEVDYTPATWAVYEAVLSQNAVDLNNTEDQIVTATKNIVEAQKSLQRKVNLTAYNKTLAAVRNADYSASSWGAYQKLLTTTVVSEDNTQTEVNAATKNIDEAQKRMVRKFDFSAYDALLAAVKEEDYVKSSWTAYQKIVNANKVSEDGNQTDVEEAIKKIETAQKKLVIKADLTYYNAAVDGVNKDDYTTASWSVYQKVVQANVVTQTSKAEVVEAATAKILEAQQSLVGIGIMDNYNKALAYNKILGKPMLRTDYTTASWAAYQQIVDANVVIPADGQPAIDAATEKIEPAQKKLVKAGDLTNYLAVLALVKAGDNTSASWTAYQNIVKANVMTGDKGQTAIDPATEKIRDAQGLLVKKGSLDLADGYRAALLLAKKEDYTPATWAVYQKILDTNAMTTDKSQEQINAAVENIKIAQEKLEKRATAAELADALKVLDIVKEDEKTVASWTIYKKILAANQLTKEKSRDELDKAVNNIKIAQGDLVPKGDTAEYNTVFNLYNGKQNDYKTLAWSTYQIALSANIMTTENKKAEIDMAVARIKQAQVSLLMNPAARMTYYNEVLDNYQGKETKGKQADFTVDSWKTYLGVITKNLKTKDNTQEDVDTATVNIENAQKNLVYSTDITAFKDAIKLYQENIQLSGSIASLATPVTWDEYANWVSHFADFEAVSGEWIPKAITAASDQKSVDDATLVINNAKNKLISSSASLTASFAAYDEAIQLSTGTVETSFTVLSYASYNAERNYAYNQFPVRIKAAKDLVDAATKRIDTMKLALLKRATDTAVFNAEIQRYEALKPKSANYTVASWTLYKNKYIDCYERPTTKLKPENNTQKEYNDATIALQALRETLVPTEDFKTTAEYASRLITKETLEAAGVTKNTNLVERAQALLTPEHGTAFSVEIVTAPPAPANVGVDQTGVVNGDKVTITLRVESTQSSYIITIADIIVTV